MDTKNLHFSNQQAMCTSTKIRKTKRDPIISLGIYLIKNKSCFQGFPFITFKIICFREI